MKNDFLIYDNGELLSKYKGDEDTVMIPDGVKIIETGAFRGCHMKNIIIPKGVTTIERCAFSLCNNLKAIKLPDGVTTINESAFFSLRNIGVVTFPDSVTYVGHDIFDNCIPYQVTVFGEVFDLDEEEIAEEYDWARIKEDWKFSEGQFAELVETIRSTAASEIPALLLNGSYDKLYMPEGLRWEIIVRALKHKPKHSNFLKMVKEHIAQIFTYLMNEPDIIRYLIDNDIFTNENINECICIANEHNSHEIENLLKEIQ